MTEATTPLLNRPLRSLDQALRDREEAQRDNMVRITLTRDELTSLMHALESERDRASKAVLLAHEPRNPYYAWVRPDMVKAEIEAAEETHRKVTELCERVTDIWKENQ